MKLVQLNVWQNRLDRQIMQFLVGEQPDIMCLQEICSSDTTMPFFQGLHGFEAIREAFPDYYHYFSLCFDAPVFGSRCYFGNATFSRFPLTETETVFTNSTYQSAETPDTTTTNIRNLQLMTVQSAEGNFRLANHHGFWAPNGMGNEESVKNMEKVAAILGQLPQPLLFSGDLNVVAKSPAMKPIHALLRDLTHENDVPTTLSDFGKVPNVPCDHICISDGIAAKNFVVSDELISDHKALIFEFGLQ